LIWGPKTKQERKREKRGEKEGKEDKGRRRDAPGV